MDVQSNGTRVIRLLGPVLGLLLGLLVAGLVVLGLQAPRGQEIAVLPPATLEPEPTPGPVRVYVSGAVAEPGVYTLPAGSIAQDALASAGGALADAALAHLDLARAVREGETLYVPRAGEAVPVPTAAIPGTEAGTGTAGALVDLNTATLEQLDTLPKIGPTTAQRILDYRAQIGGFTSVEQLNNVTGIGDATFAAIKDYVCVCTLGGSSQP